MPAPAPVLNGVIGYMVFTVPESTPAGVYPVTITKAEVNSGTVASDLQSGSVRIESKTR